VPWYYRLRTAINVAVPFLAPTQQTNLALLVSAILKKRTLCLSELARAYPIPKERRVRDPKHCLLHRLKRLWRFTDNARVDAQAVQLAVVAHTVARLGFPRLVGLAIDWTFFDTTTLPSGEGIRYQVLRIAIPRKGRALPLLQLAYDRDRLPADKSQNQLEQDALLAVLKALPEGVRPVVLADRGFHRASFIRWLQRHDLHYVVRIRKGSCITDEDGRGWKLGQEGLKSGEMRWLGGVRYGLYHGRPRDLLINVALCWRVPKSKLRRDPRRGRKVPAEAWYLATSLASAEAAASWYWQRGWIEQSFKDSKGRFGLARVRIGSAERLGRLLMALTIALSWLTLAALPESGALPEGFRARVCQRGRASVTSLALALLDELGNLPPSCLPRSTTSG
jgi:hypothetical protein